MKAISFKPVILSAILLASGANGYSQQVADSVNIDEVVITATRTLRNLNEVPARISVVGANIIETSPALQVDDILRYTSGVNVNRSGGIFTIRPTVTLRGLSGDEQSRTLVLMNGVPINASDGGSVNWNRINTYDVERIEVFKGPGSSLYGSSAMGGVINIITKTPDRPQEVNASVSYGTFNTIREDLNARIRSDKGYYGSISQYYLKSDGFNSIPKEDRNEYDIKRSLEALGISSKAGYDQSEWFKWELQYDLYRDKRGEGTQIHTPDGNYRRFDTDLVRGLLKGGNEKTKYDLNLYYQMVHYTDLNESMRGTNYTRYDVDSHRKDYGALLNASHVINDKNTISGGLEYKNGSIKGGDYYQTEPYDTVFNRGTTRIFAGYIQDEHAFLDNKIRLIAGLRFDYVTFSNGEYYATSPWGETPELKDNNWSELSPRVGLRFNFIKELSAYVSYSHGFRASILDDLTRTGYMWVGPKYANPNLGPESLDNFEIGADLLLTSRFKLSASGYHSIGDDFLYYVASGDELSPGRPIYRRENVTGVTLSGLEVEANYMPLENLRFMSSYTFSHSRINKFDERPDLENKYLTYVPKNTFSASVFWQNKIVDISVRGLYKSKQFSDDLNTSAIGSYTTVDMQLSRKITTHLYANIEIQDIFDNQHMETQTEMSPGRVIMGKLVLRF